MMADSNIAAIKRARDAKRRLSNLVAVVTPVGMRCGGGAISFILPGHGRRIRRLRSTHKQHNTKPSQFTYKRSSDHALISPPKVLNSDHSNDNLLYSSGADSTDHEHDNGDQDDGRSEGGETGRVYESIKRAMSRMKAKIEELRRRKKQAAKGLGSEEEDEMNPWRSSDYCGVWQRGIMMGKKCQPLTFSGLILYDEKGNRVGDFQRKPPSNLSHQ